MSPRSGRLTGSQLDRLSHYDKELLSTFPPSPTSVGSEYFGLRFPRLGCPRLRLSLCPPASQAGKCRLEGYALDPTGKRK